MKIGILITARMGSERLPGKHLLLVGGKPILSYLLRRIEIEFDQEIRQELVDVVIATSEEAENRKFDEVFGETVSVAHGSSDNIPLRHLQAAKKYNLDGIVSVDGDDILCSVRGMRKVYEGLQDGYQYVKTSDLPLGLNSSGYLTDFLERSLSGREKELLETGWTWIFGDDNNVRLLPVECVEFDDSLLRFTLDYQQDFDFFRKTIISIGQDIDRVTDDQILNEVVTSEIYLLNEGLSKAYWENYYSRMERERKAIDAID